MAQMFERFVNVFYVTGMELACIPHFLPAFAALLSGLYYNYNQLFRKNQRKTRKIFRITVGERLRLSFVKAFLDAFTIYVGIAFAPSVEQRASRIVCVAPRSPIGAMPWA